MSIRVGTRIVKIPLLDLDLVEGVNAQRKVFLPPTVISTYHESQMS